VLRRMLIPIWKSCFRRPSVALPPLMMGKMSAFRIKRLYAVSRPDISFIYTHNISTPLEVTAVDP